jgi:hypothetical protein
MAGGDEWSAADQTRRSPIAGIHKTPAGEVEMKLTLNKSVLKVLTDKQSKAVAGGQFGTPSATTNEQECCPDTACGRCVTRRGLGNPACDK